MEAQQRDDLREQKKSEGRSDRPLTTGLFLLRCAQLGLSMADLDLLTVGMVYDMLIENGNDGCADAYAKTATQADFDAF